MIFINKKIIVLLILFFYFQNPSFANSYRDGVNEYNKKDYSKAHEIWTKVTQKTPVSDSFEWKKSNQIEITNAQYGLALLYWQGKGVKQNFKKSQYWLELAAKQDHIEAELKLGYLMLNALTGKKDEKKARSWFKKAAELGNSDAQYNVAILYLNGVGGNKDLAKAKYWLTQAQKSGDKEAEKKLISLNSKQPLPKNKPSTSKPPKSQAENISPTENVLYPIENVLNQPEAKYAIQVAALSKKLSLYSLIKTFPEKLPWYFYLKHKDNKQYYILMTCCFSDLEQANKTKKGLHLNNKKLKPFIVNLEIIR